MGVVTIVMLELFEFLSVAQHWYARRHHKQAVYTVGPVFTGIKRIGSEQRWEGRPKERTAGRNSRPQLRDGEVTSDSEFFHSRNRGPRNVGFLPVLDTRRLGSRLEPVCQNGSQVLQNGPTEGHILCTERPGVVVQATRELIPVLDLISGLSVFSL